MALCQSIILVLLSVVFCCSVGLSEEEKNQQSVDGKYEDQTEDPMFGDAIPVPTPAVCGQGVTCGFLAYDDATTGNHHHTFTHYCHCPDGLECIREGTNMELRYYYFKCQNATEVLEYSSKSSSVSAQHRRERASNEPLGPTQDNTESLKRLGHVNEEL